MGYRLRYCKEHGMTRMRIYVTIGIAILAIFVLGQTVAMAGGGRESGMRFSMEVQAPERDPVEFEGIVLGGNQKLSSVAGSIDTVSLLIGSKWYHLTPAIKTARLTENPPAPGVGEDGWVEWLIEPGRINPLAFAERVGKDSGFTGTVNAGPGARVHFVFSDGRLGSVEFPAGRGNGVIKYICSDFETDNSVKAADLEIPSDYLVIE